MYYVINMYMYYVINMYMYYVINICKLYMQKWKCIWYQSVTSIPETLMAHILDQRANTFYISFLQALDHTVDCTGQKVKFTPCYTMV